VALGPEPGAKAGPAATVGLSLPVGPAGPALGSAPAGGFEGGDITDITAVEGLVEPFSAPVPQPSAPAASRPAQGGAPPPPVHSAKAAPASPRGALPAERTAAGASAGAGSPGAADRTLELAVPLALLALFLLDFARRVAGGRAAAVAESGRRPERPG
jgi:hypothetical protein